MIAATNAARVRFAVSAAALAATLVFSGCAGTPPPPDWKMNAQAGLEAYTRHYLAGNSRLAEINFAKARTEANRTGRPDIVARVELARCGVRAAALEFDACPGYTPFADTAGAGEAAYARFLSNRWQGLDGAALAKPYATLLRADGATARNAALPGIADPLSRLIAAAALLQSGELSPVGIATAVDTASERGWRRPLLAWLGVQLRGAEAAGDGAAAGLIRKRIELATPPQDASP